MSKALYRKYRSKSLDEVVGQKHVTDILSRSIAKGRISHAYLLTGPRGVGKTSIARILAHEINKLPYDDDATHLDIIEIDAASNNGVEDVRDLREKVQIAPVSANKKVYIIDEVHMLSKAAFNALLKTLEEPPEHVVFILATTDADKLPATIISRTQQFGFRSINQKDAVGHLRMIADAEKIIVDDESLNLIATRGDGSFRDSISLLDQLSSLTDEKMGITPALIEASLGLASTESVAQILQAVRARDTAAIVTALDQFDESGVQPTVLTSQLIQFIRSKIAEAPQLITLLDSLLEVSKSSQPSLKLLTVLVSSSMPKPRTAALVAAAPMISAPVASLANTPPDAPSSSTPIARQYQSPPSAPRQQIVRQNAAASRSGNKNSKEKVAVDAAPLAGYVGTLDWNKLIEHVRQNYVALHSVLSKCSYVIDGENLTLYTVKRFNKTKLDDAKYRLILAQCLIATGAGDLVVETIGTPPPPADSQAAAIAELMGGGEQVTVSG